MSKKINQQVNPLNKEELLAEIRVKVAQMRNYTPKVGVFGNSGVGKSSLCNALFGKEVAKVNDVEACTRKPQEIFISSSGKKNSSGINLVDVPGIGEDPKRQKEYTELYKSLVKELDLVLWAIKSDDRNYDSAIRAYEEVFKKNKSAPPVIFVITQTDKTNDTDDWNHEFYKPGGVQIQNITTKENDVSRRFDVSTKYIISIAASLKKGKSYNLKELVDLVVEVLPNEKKYSFTREAKEENVTEEARRQAEKGVWDSVKEFCGDAYETVKEAVKDVVIATVPTIIKSAVSWIKSWW